MKKSRKNLLLYGLVMLLVLALTGAAWAAPADTKSSEAKSAEMQPASVFKDVQAGDSNLIYINYLAKREIISGFPDGGFHPNEGLSRAQAATLLVRAAGLSSKEKKAVFKDVYAGHWAAANIAAAAEAGYLKGYPDGTYHPEEKLSRAQGISLVLRLSKQKDTGVELPSLKDLDSKHWAARSVAIGLAAGMVGLTSDKTQFLPDANFSRGDLSRALAVLLTTDPDLNQTSLNGSLEIKKGEVKVNDQKVTGTISVKAGDLITTSAGAEAQLSYPDGSSLLIKENSKITVKESKGRAYIKKDGSPGTAVDWLLVDVKVGSIFGALATNPNAQEEKSEKKTAGLKEKLLAGLSGALEYLAAGDQAPPWYKTAEAKKVKVKVDMPYGVAAIRGSFWQNIVNTNGSGSTNLLEGSAEVSAGGQTVALPPGQSSSGTPGGAPPTPAAPMTTEQVTGWVQQGSWLQTVAQTMQQNQEAPRTEAVITQVVQGPVPGQPAPQLPLTQLPIPPVTPPPVPPVPDILNLVTQALNQAQQSVGLPVVPPGSQLPAGYNPIGGGGGGAASTTEETSSISNALRLSRIPAYLHVNSLSVSNNTLSLSGKTSANDMVVLHGPFTGNAPSVMADAAGNFSFTSLALYPGLTAGSGDNLMIEQVSGSAQMISRCKGQLVINNFLGTGTCAPQIPAYLELNRGNLNTAGSATISGLVTPRASYYLKVFGPGSGQGTGTSTEIQPGSGTPIWAGEVNAAAGSFSLDIGTQTAGTDLYLTFATDENVSPLMSGRTNVFSENNICVLATNPANNQSAVAISLNTIWVYFDRNVSATDLSGITLKDQNNDIVATNKNLAGNAIGIVITGSLANDRTYTVSIPSGIIKDSYNSAVVLGNYSFSFSTPANSNPGPNSDTTYQCITSNQPGGPTFAYSDISSNYDSYNKLTDDTYIEQNFGFNFNFYGTDYNKAYIGTNGYITFGSGDSTYSNYSFPASGSKRSYPRIAAFFDDLMPHLTGSGIYRKVVGTSPNRQLIVQWRLQDHYYSSPNTVDFQVILYEGSNRILFQYQDTTFGNSNDHGGSATVGLNKGDGQKFLQYSYNTPSLTDSLAILYSPTSQVGIQTVTATPNPIQPSSSEQSVNVAISSSGLANDTAVTVQLYIPGATPTPVGNPVNTSISANAATAVLTIPASTGEGSYIIRVSGSGFSNYDLPFQITNWMGLVNNMNLPVATSCSTTALAGDSSNGVYAAYVENNPMKPAIKKLSGMSWEDWGPAAIAGWGYTDLAMTSGGDAYLAYRNSSNQATVSSKVYNSSTWTDLGAVSGDTVDRLSLATCSSKPYLSYSTTNSIQTYVYDCGGWASLGSINSPAGGISLAWNQYYSKPYLAYSSGTSVNCYVYESAWVLLDSAIASNAAANSPVSLAINCTGNPYVAYRDSANNVMVKMYSGSWNPVGNADVQYVAGRSTDNHVSLAFNGTTPYLVYSDSSLAGADNGRPATVAYWNGTNWVTLGSPGFTPTAVTEPRIKIIGSEVYVIYKEYQTNNIKVMKRALPPTS